MILTVPIRVTSLLDNKLDNSLSEPLILTVPKIGRTICVLSKKRTLPSNNPIVFGFDRAFLNDPKIDGYAIANAKQDYQHAWNQFRKVKGTSIPIWNLKSLIAFTSIL